MPATEITQDLVLVLVSDPPQQNICVDGVAVRELRYEVRWELCKGAPE